MDDHRRLKKIFKWIAGIFFALVSLVVVVLVGLIVWIAVSPSSVWNVVQTRFLPSDLQIGWRTIKFEMAAPELLHPKMDFALDGLWMMWLKPNEVVPQLMVPDVNFAVEAQMNLFSSEPLLQVKLVELHSKDLVAIEIPASKTSSPESSFYQLYDGIYGTLETLKKRGRLERLELDVPELQIKLSESQVLSLLNVSAKRGAPDEEFVVAAKAQLSSLGQNPDRPLAWGHLLEADAKLRADLTAIDVADKNTLSGDLEVKIPPYTLKNQLSLRALDGKAQLSLETAFSWAQVKTTTSGTLKLEAELNERELHLSPLLGLENLPGPWVKVKDLKGDIRIPQTDGETWSHNSTKFSVQAPLDLFFVDQKLRPVLEEVCSCKLPEKLLVKLGGGVWLKTLIQNFNAEKDFSKVAELNAEVESLTNKFVDVDLKANLIVDKKLSEYRYHPVINGNLAIKSFKSMQRILNSQGIMVPAPLDVLEGEVRLKMEGAVEWSKDETLLPAELIVDLKSDSQSVKAVVNSNLRLKNDLKEIDMDVKAKVQELYLQLPPLDPLGGIPRVTKDSRIQLAPKVAPKKKKAAVIFRLSVDVETLTPGAIRLFSKYAKPYVPLSLKIDTETGREVRGFIQLEPFSVTYLRRTVNLESLRLGLTALKQGQESEFPLKGRMRVDQTDYRIFIDVAGTTKTPQVLLTSEPSLSQDEIISVLLFDRTTSQLDSGDAETAGGVRGAMADKAIGLFGLWAFATTPIRSFSYNPVTKTYTATLQVSDGLTAGIGTTWEQTTNVELRKRVSREWVLTAAWAPGENDDTKSSLVLQWEKRF